MDEHVNFCSGHNSCNNLCVLQARVVLVVSLALVRSDANSVSLAHPLILQTLLEMKEQGFANWWCVLANPRGPLRTGEGHRQVRVRAWWSNDLPGRFRFEKLKSVSLIQTEGKQKIDGFSINYHENNIYIFDEKYLKVQLFS